MTWRDWLLSASRWLLAVAIVLSAWLYGGTREWTADVLRWWLLATGVVFATGLAVRGRWPRVPLVVVVPSVLLGAGGLFFWWNAQRQFIPFAGVFVDTVPAFPSLPGFVDHALTLPGVLSGLGLLACLWIACDLAANRVWRRRLWITIAATGTSIMVLGLTQKFTGATSILWDVHTFTGRTFFAVFRYHANAGAYINLVLPFILCAAVAAFHRPGARLARVGWTLSALVTAACGFINVSRAANVLTFLLLAVFASWVLGRHLAAGGSGRGRAMLAAGTVAAAAAVLAFAFGTDRTFQRWQHHGVGDLLENNRYETYRVIVLGPLPEAGVAGFGPGTFEHVFNQHRAALQAPVEGRWTLAHSDALQTPMDYGWGGAACWLLLLAGGIWQGVRAAKAGGRGWTETELLGAACVLSLSGVLVHGLVDFPLQIPSIQILTVTAAGLAWGLGREARRP